MIFYQMLKRDVKNGFETTVFFFDSHIVGLKL